MLFQFRYAPPPNCQDYHDHDWSAWDAETYEDGDPKGYGRNPLAAHFDYICQADGQTAAMMQLDQLMAHAEKLMKSEPILTDEMPASNSLGVTATGCGSRRDGPSYPNDEPIAPNPSFDELLALGDALRAVGFGDKP